MKKCVICIISLCISLQGFSQKVIEVVEFKQNATDISARTNQREDPRGEACALVKVQFPIRNALFDGNIIGEISYKTNEYWVYMPQQSSQLKVNVKGYIPLTIDFNSYGVSTLESKGTYDLCLTKKEADSPQLYIEGMTALAKNDILTAYEKLGKASESGYAPAAYAMGEASLIPYDKNYDQDPNSVESYQEAYEYFKSAADRSNPEAQYALGAMLLDYQNKRSEELSKINVDSAILDNTKIWELIRNAADKGIADAQYRMINDDQWCKDNAAKGVAIAEFGMGLRYDQELDTEEYPLFESLEIDRVLDTDVAFSWYQKAANHGLDVAQWRLGEMYARGIGVESNIDEAISWRIKSVEQGNPIFQLMMGFMYSFGGFSDYSTYVYSDGYHYRIDVPVDADKADYWLRKLNHRELSKTESNLIEANGVYSSSIDELASLLMRKKEYYKAIYWYQRKIELDYRDACCNLGKIYFEGKGVSKDFQKARSLFESALEDGTHYNDLKDEALCYLGIIYRDGLGVEADRDKALDYLKKSTHNGYGPTISYYELGNLYYGDMMYDEAFKYYREAKSNCFDRIEDGKYVWLNEVSTKACYKLGMMYDEGLGVEKNSEKAIDYMNEAASRGSDDAKRYLQDRNLPIPSPKLGSKSR